MNEYSVKVTFSFEGVFLIKAKNLQHAMEMIHDDVGLTLGGDIHTTLDEETIDWKFPVHAKKSITEINKE
jgi:hypothetical protein